MGRLLAARAAGCPRTRGRMPPPSVLCGSRIPGSDLTGHDRAASGDLAVDLDVDGSDDGAPIVTLSTAFNHTLGNVVLQQPLFHAINPDNLTSFTAAGDASPDPTVQWQVSTDRILSSCTPALVISSTSGSPSNVPRLTT